MSARALRPNRPAAPTPLAANLAPPVDPGPARVERVAWVLTATLGLVMIGLVLGPHRIGDYFTETDFYGGYGPGARLFQAGVPDPGRYGVVGPGFDAALAVVGALTRDLFVAGRAISIASTLAVLLAWFALLRRRAGGAAALWTVAFLAANGTLLRHGTSATTDALALALQAGALWCAFGARARWAPLAAGALVACAALTRYTAVALLPALLVAAAFAPRGERLRGTLLTLAGFAALALPAIAWFARAGHVPGEMLFHDVAFEAYAAGSGRTLADYQAQLQPGLHSLGQAIAHDPLTLLRRELANAAGHVRTDASELLGWPTAALALLGAVAVTLERAWHRWLPLALVAIALYLALVPAAASARYSLVLAPCYLALAGAAAASPRLARLARVGPVALVQVCALVALAFSVRASVATERETFALLPVETRQAAQVLHASQPSGARVVALKPHLAWYAGAEPVPFPTTDRIDALAKACRRAGAQWLYVSWIEAANRPAFWYLLDPSASVPGLHAVSTTTRNASVLWAIGPGFGAEPAWLANDSVRVAAETRVVAAMPAGYDWRARLSLAVWARGAGRWAEAREHALAAIARHPDLALAERLVGEADMHLGDVAGARAAYERAVALEPESVDAHVALGWLCLAAGDEPGAAKAWRPVAGRITHRPTLERMLAIFRARGDAAAEGEARGALERAGQ